MSLILKFQGWFEVRLATDPDPTDEPRGVSGYAHAIAGEPDFDRVIRFNAPIAPRSHGPKVGVSISNVWVDGKPDQASPLGGGQVDLLDAAVFEGRNGIVAQSGTEPIVPFHIQVAAPKVRLSRRSTVERAPYAELQAYGAPPPPGDPGAIGEATGIWDAATYYAERATLLKADLEKATTDVERAALQARLAMISGPRLPFFVGMFQTRLLYSFPLAGAVAVEDEAHVLPTDIGSQPWHVEFWCGAWDADAFCAYVLGYLSISTKASKMKAPMPKLFRLEQA
jgi:hypothetical protein